MVQCDVPPDRWKSQDETMASTSLDHAISVRTHPSILANLHPEVRDQFLAVVRKIDMLDRLKFRKIRSWYGKHTVRHIVFIMPSRFWCYKLQWWYISTWYRSIRACPTWGQERMKPCEEKVWSKATWTFCFRKIEYQRGVQWYFSSKKRYPKSFRVFQSSWVMRYIFWIHFASWERSFLDHFPGHLAHIAIAWQQVISPQTIQLHWKPQVADWTIYRSRIGNATGRLEELFSTFSRCVFSVGELQQKRLPKWPDWGSWVRYSMIFLGAPFCKLDFDRQGSHSDLFTRQNSPIAVARDSCFARVVWNFDWRNDKIADMMHFIIVLDMLLLLCNWRIAEATLLVTHPEFAELLAIWLCWSLTE